MNKLKVVTLKKEEENEKNQINNSEEFATLIAEILDSKKAKKITIINVSGKTIISDYFVIAGANSSTQIKALMDNLDEKLSKDYGIEPLHKDVDQKWAAIDYGTVIVHIMKNEIRDFYQLERLWADGDNMKILDNID